MMSIGTDGGGWPDPDQLKAKMVADLADLALSDGPIARIMAAALEGLPGTPEDLAATAALSEKFWRLRISMPPPIVAREIGDPCAACGKNTSARVLMSLMSCNHEDLLCLACLGDPDLTPQGTAALWASACRLVPGAHATAHPACKGTIRRGAILATASSDRGDGA